MSEVSNGKPEPVGDSGGWGGVRKKWSGRWHGLPPAKREQYEAIEDRVREKMRKGLL